MIARWGFLLSAAIAASAPLALAGCAFDATEDQATKQASHHEMIVASDDSSSQNGNGGTPQPQPPQPEPSPWHTSPHAQPEPSPWQGADRVAPSDVQGGQAEKSFLTEEYLRQVQAGGSQR